MRGLQTLHRCSTSEPGSQHCLPPAQNIPFCMQSAVGLSSHCREQADIARKPTSGSVTQRESDLEPGAAPDRWLGRLATDGVVVMVACGMGAEGTSRAGPAITKGNLALKSYNCSGYLGMPKSGD
jgi:hypothetical protein